MRSIVSAPKKTPFRWSQDVSGFEESDVIGRCLATRIQCYIRKGHKTDCAPYMTICTSLSIEYITIPYTSMKNIRNNPYTVYLRWVSPIDWYHPHGTTEAPGWFLHGKPETARVENWKSFSASRIIASQLKLYRDRLLRTDFQELNDETIVSAFSSRDPEIMRFF